MVLGHSFVDRLHCAYASEARVTYLEEHIAQDLKVAFIYRQVFFLGYRGLTIGKLSCPEYFFSLVRPARLVLDIGTNDIAQGSSGFSAANSVFSSVISPPFPDNLEIVFLSVVPRQAGFRGVPLTFFQEERLIFNRTLSQLCDSHPRTLFCRQKGFAEWDLQGKKVPRDMSTWSKDGIHPDSGEGMRLYKRSLSRALRMPFEVMGQSAKF